MTEPQEPKPAYDGVAPYEPYGATPSYQTEQYPSQTQYGGGQQYPAAPSYAAPQYATAQPPKSNAGWAVASILFFWPVAFAAFNHLHDIYPKWAMGDHHGAQYASERVKKLGQIAVAVFVVGMVVFVIGYAILVALLISTANDITYRY
ncbi:MFS family permease [Rhodococcus sp. 27YEA15]|uniref:CD225/dispanin family protein n=1 Tax=Rhodococcus sp. 27YEA15 TaxID=3156259 RepID=UPI003C7BBB85